MSLGTLITVSQLFLKCAIPFPSSGLGMRHIARNEAWKCGVGMRIGIGPENEAWKCGVGMRHGNETIKPPKASF